MENFNGKTNEDFIKYFTDELYSKTEFIQFDDPDDYFDPEQEYGKHIIESNHKLLLFIKSSMSWSDNAIDIEEKQKIFEEKKTELFEILDPEIELYITKINVDYK